MYHFLSYPKCGRTWVFAMIGKYIALKKGLSDSSIVHYAYDRNSKTGYLPMGKSHGGYAPQEKKFFESLQTEIRDSKIILLTRNPYDTILSHYYDARARKPFFRGTLTQFIQDSDIGANNLKKYLEFTDTLSPEYVFSYEELHENPVKGVEPIISLLLGGEEVDLDTLEEAVKFCRADNLRKLEEDFRQNKLKGVDMRSQGRMRKVRKAVVGSYKEEMNKKQIDLIDNILGERSL